MARRILALLALAALLHACSDSPSGPARDRDADGGTWATWVLPSASALRPPAPPAAGSAEAVRDLEEVLRIQRESTLSDADLRRWDGPPTTPWTELAVELLEFYWALLPDVRTATPVRSSRILALLHVAIYDALVATWDAKYAYERRPPFQVDRRVRRRVPDPGVPSYPSEHAAAAAAAAAVLEYLFPLEDPERFRSMVRAVAEARIAAGVAFPSDVEAGLALGRAVAERVIAYAKTDGSDAEWTGTMPEGPDMWKPTPPRRIYPPYEPLAGAWRTWVIPGGDAFRPPPPPAPGSAAFEADLDELRQLSRERTPEQADIARYWGTGPPSLRWVLYLEEEIARRGLSPLRAARAHALVSVAIYDAFMACWDAKYVYWLARPITMDTTIVTVFSTPPFPSYPSGHSTISTAAAEVFAELFPDRADMYHGKALEASISRVYAAVHYRFDVLAGEELGTRVGQEVVRRARADGSS